MRSSMRRSALAAANLLGLSLLAAVAWGDSGTGGSDVRRTVAQYSIPNVTLVRADGKSVNMAAELDDGRPVVVNFVYTSCATICPMSSQVFAQFQGQLGSARPGCRAGLRCFTTF
jgi:cytochrome oxidase Cu insertion factor (SCO1/SenC/PrrC family)